MRWLTLFVVAATAAGLSEVRAETLPLPPGVISFESDEGEALLIGAEARNDFFPLSQPLHQPDQPGLLRPGFDLDGPQRAGRAAPALGPDARARSVRSGEHLHPGH